MKARDFIQIQYANKTKFCPQCSHRPREPLHPTQETDEDGISILGWQCSACETFYPELVS